MAVFRIEKTKNYTVVSSYRLRNHSLSLKAKGLRALILSPPENWDFTMKGLACICQDGLSSVRFGVTELKQRGYLTRHCIREVHPLRNPMRISPSSSKAMSSVYSFDNFLALIRSPITNLISKRLSKSSIVRFLYSLLYLLIPFFDF